MRCAPALLGAQVALAGDPQCFRIALPNLTESGAKITASAPARWCYWAEGDQTLVFSADGTPDEARAALVRWSADHHIAEITHGSLVHGVTTIHRSHVTEVNPLPVPLDPAELPKLGATRAPEILPSEIFNEAQALRQRFDSNRARAFDVTISEGTTTVQLEESQQPFAGFWWPQVGLPIAAGKRSPLGKYDAIVTHWTRTNPDSVGWEKQHHAATESWAGHCNGWAASAILYPDFAKLLWDKDAKLVVLPSDIKGMLAEASFCVDTAFYGQRYNGNQGDDPSDIHPAQFHQVLVYYLQELKKPLAFDHEASAEVDNNVISGYRMTVQHLGGRTYRVSTELHSHDYEHFRNEQSGPAKLAPYVYQYTLTTDGAGKITGGQWESENPDFLWAPVAEKACGSENPRVDPAQVQKMIATLPEAKKVSVPLDFTLERRLRAHEAVPIPFQPHAGTGYQVTIHKNNFQSPVKLVAIGTPLYPTAAEDYQVMAQEPLDGSADAEIYIPLSDLRSLQIVNDSKYPTQGNHLVIEKAEFWAGD